MKKLYESSMQKLVITILIYSLSVFNASTMSKLHERNINASNLFEYTGHTEGFDLDHNETIEEIDHIDFNFANARAIAQNVQYQAALCDHTTAINVGARPSVEIFAPVAKTFFEKISFNFIGNWNVYETSKLKMDDLAAIEVVIYKIASNPVGLRLLQRILNRIPMASKIEFKIGGNEFIYSDRSVTIPIILIDDSIARRNDNVSYSPKLIDERLVLSIHNRPFYIGLVHELIHFMHELEGRRSGTHTNSLSHDDFGGTDLWGDSDDLHAIWGVYAIAGRDIEYDNVSELTFRIADNVPIRMFYESVAPVGDVTTLDKYVYENFEDYGEKYLDEFGEDEDINAINILKNVLENIGVDKKIVLSL